MKNVDEGHKSRTVLIVTVRAARSARTQYIVRLVTVCTFLLPLSRIEDRGVRDVIKFRIENTISTSNEDQIPSEAFYLFYCAYIIVAIMTEDLFASLAFPVHLSLWILHLRNISKVDHQLTIDNCLADFSEENISKVDNGQSSNKIHKSESEFSLGLNRSESLAHNLNQYGRPCFMQYSLQDVLMGLVNENFESLIVASSVAVIYCIASGKYFRS